ncbi:MAG: hypothetical protein WCB49_13895 [Gammaproteobacteria bacterium]
MTLALPPWRRRDWLKQLDRAWRRCSSARSGLKLDALDVLREDLLRHIRIWTALDRNEGLLQARNELMDSTERMLLQRTLRELEPGIRTSVASKMPEFKPVAENLDRYLAAETLRLDVLRAWMGFYYGDRARGDWYDVYCKAAEMRLESIGRDFERIAGMPVYKAEDNRDAAIRGINASLRLRLLQMSPGARVGRPGLRTRWNQWLNRNHEANEHNG